MAQRIQKNFLETHCILRSYRELSEKPVAHYIFL
jgi:hypothetical protein